MAIKKSELYSSIWTGCDLLRGGMDASQYKDYILVLLFVLFLFLRFCSSVENRINEGVFRSYEILQF